MEQKINRIEKKFRCVGISTDLLQSAINVLRAQNDVNESFHKLCIEMLIQCVQTPDKVASYDLFARLVRESARKWAEGRFDRLLERLRPLTGVDIDSDATDLDSCTSDVSEYSSESSSCLSEDEIDLW